jgi:hypothetical protein
LVGNLISDMCQTCSRQLVCRRSHYSVTYMDMAHYCEMWNAMGWCSVYLAINTDHISRRQPETNELASKHLICARNQT